MVGSYCGSVYVNDGGKFYVTLLVESLWYQGVTEIGSSDDMLDRNEDYNNEVLSLEGSLGSKIGTEIGSSNGILDVSEYGKIEKSALGDTLVSQGRFEMGSSDDRLAGN